ncbi:inosine-5-monophosphate dehydrogenase [Luteitalea sp. TBR-22]|uniref:CBS domain-containing protein n=1 Tax=Luteitalea sp. TBR-22 TaxID=2802971 RepID=UPI001AF63D13|nr:CBS domain-containing protein [Luteitalea sp. TBR-22]BCS31844.1 inosine-5-monophosphate dehydrogenase [Luteitalea sp. TBR-22]
MQLATLMTPDPATCTPDTPIEEIARLMRTHDCGEIPVVEHASTRTLLGVVTDRDMVLRVLAEGRDARAATAADCMTSPALSLTAEARVSDAVEMMQAHQVRRLPIVDEGGRVCGIVSQADLARATTAELTGDLVRDVSEPTRSE